MTKMFRWTFDFDTMMQVSGVMRWLFCKKKKPKSTFILSFFLNNEVDIFVFFRLVKTKDSKYVQILKFEFNFSCETFTEN